MATEVAARTHIAAQLPPGRVLTGVDHDRARRVWNAAVEKTPELIVRPETTEEVARAVLAAREVGVPITVRGAGHDWAGRAIGDGAMVIDLSAMRAVEIEGTVATVGGGATADELLGVAAEHGLSAAMGAVGSVGVVGLLLGGGYGSLIGALGLSIDSLLSAQVVLADGSITVTDLRNEPELFWALRGGGGNFGVVTQVAVQLHPIPDVTAGTVAFGWAQAEQVLRGLQNLYDTIDDEFDVMFGAMHTPAGTVLFTSPVWAGSADAADHQIDRVRALGDPVLDDVARRSYAQIVRVFGESFPAGGNYRLGARVVARIDDAFIEAFTASVDAMPPNCALNVHVAHGVATRVAPDATAHIYRQPHLVVEILGISADGDGVAETEWVLDTERRLDAVSLPGGWTNLMAPDDPRNHQAHGPNRARLAAAKERYDPARVFNGVAPL